MNLTLADVAANPQLLTHDVELAAPEPARPERVVWRPLQASDVDELGAFLAGLSPTTRRFAIFPSYDKAAAQELCDAINRYDKLRFVVEHGASNAIIGLFEFSFDITDSDRERYARHGIELDARHDCRFGPTLADAYQNRGLASALFPFVVEVARRFGKQRIILWGGVLADNGRAIRFYQKQGFVPVGMFEDRYGELLFDMMLEIVPIYDSRRLH